MKACDSCSLCCKLLYIRELAKPAGAWCPHVAKGRGCGVYDDRPAPCRDFRCNWLTHDGLDDRWRPDRSGFILWTVSATVMLVVVEPAKPDAWKRRPYYDQLKDWSRTALTGQGMVLIKVRNATTVVLPHADVFIGEVAVTDTVSIDRQATGPVQRLWVSVTREDGSVTRYAA